MDKEKELELTVNGFQFGSKEDVEIAQQELSAIQYIDKKIENRSGETILSVYQAALEKRMFRTPIGYSYLHELQKRILQNGIEREKIPGIPLYQIYNSNLKDDIKPVHIVKRKKVKDYTKQRLRNSILANIILVILVIALFFISLTGSNPTILNYRQKILNEYSQWEQELDVREQTIREKEKNLGIDSTGNHNDTTKSVLTE